jgi:hypothetical protein
MASEPDISYEKKIDLAIQALQEGQIPSIRAAAAFYHVSYVTLSRHLRRRTTRRDAQINNRKLTPTEEEALHRKILSMDERGINPTIPAVRKMADLLLSKRLKGVSVGDCWVRRFVNRHDDLRSKFLRKYDYQRAKCEDPVQIKAWFDRVQATITKYGILPEDMYNFDETGFQMGIIATTKVIARARARGQGQARGRAQGRPKVIQPGDRTWVTVIEGINAQGWALPATIIFAGKVNQSTWYEAGIPEDWIITTSENGWTDCELGFKWLTKIFDKHTRSRTVGTYRLLFLDGHKSHFTSEFEDFCEENNIIYLCPPPHSTHLLQALDVGCFSPLKNAYGRLVQDKSQLGIRHIDKIDFLNLFYQARQVSFTEKNIKKAFEAVGLVPYDPKKVLSRFHTPSPQLVSHGLPDSPRRQLPLQTPYDIDQLDAQIKALRQLRPMDSTSPSNQILHHIIKGCQVAMYGATLLMEENDRLREENQRQHAKRIRRSYIGHRDFLTVAEGLQRVEERAQVGQGTRARSGAPQQRLCGICRAPGHDRRKCPGNADSTQDSIHVII